MAATSESIPKVLSLKVQQYAAGRIYPFDKAYLFPEEALGHAKKAFPNSIIFNIKHEMKTMLSQLFVSEIQSRDSGRHYTSQAVSRRTHMHRLQPREENDTPLLNRLLAFLQDDASKEIWLQQIPILGVYKEEKYQRPGYICNDRWSNSSNYTINRYKLTEMRQQGISLNRCIPDTGMLVTGGVEHSPPCLACARILDHMAGNCELGGKVCMETMEFGDTSYFLDGIRLSEKLQSSSVDKLLAFLRGDVEELDSPEAES